MKKMTFFLALLTGILFVSCSKDVDEDINSMNTCETENMSFQDDILPIFNNNCNSCHSASANFGGITLDNHADTKTVVDRGRLLGAVKRMEGFSAMPQGGSKLSDCIIDKLSVWVADGAPNN